MATKSAAFTFIELLVVIVVLSVLAAIVAPNVFRHVGTAKDAAVIVLMLFVLPRFVELLEGAGARQFIRDTRAEPLC